MDISLCARHDLSIAMQLQCYPSRSYRFYFLYLLPLGILSTTYLFHTMFLAVKNGSHEIQCRHFSTILGSPGQESEITGITTQKGV